jgi:hypothetical protein
MPGAPKVVHLHIPKTAGTAVNHAFFKLYDSSRICPARYEPEFKSIEPEAFDFFTGHIGFDVASLLHLPIVCLLRDPIDRFISVYYYWRQLYEKERRRDFGIQAAHSLSLEEFVERFDEASMAEEFYNRMTWQFAASHHLGSRRDYICLSRGELLDLARSNLSKCAVVGRQENMAGFVADCKRTLGIELEVDFKNVTAQRMAADDVPLSIRRRIADWVQLDLELYWSLTKTT